MVISYLVSLLFGIPLSCYIFNLFLVLSACKRSTHSLLLEKILVCNPINLNAQLALQAPITVVKWNHPPCKIITRQNGSKLEVRRLHRRNNSSIQWAMGQWDNPGRVLKVMLMFLAKQTELPVTNQDPGFRIHTTNKLLEISICLFFTAVFKKMSLQGFERFFKGLQ